MKKNLTTLFFCFISLVIYGQERMLHGVLEDQGEPLLFATVAVYRNGVLQRGVETDLDGKYAVLCMPGDEIETSYIGYTPQRFTVTHRMLTGEQDDQVPVEPQKSESYSKEIEERSLKWDDENVIKKDSQARVYRLINSYHRTQAIDLKVDDNELKFIIPKKPYSYNVDVNQVLGISYIQKRNLHDLQNTYAQGRPINGVSTFLDHTTGEHFSWGPKNDRQAIDNNILRPSIFSSTNFKYDGMKGRKRHFLSFTHKRQSDIFNRGRQKETKGQLGVVIHKGGGNDLVGEISFNLSNRDNHNAGGYYQDVLKAMLIQSPSFDSSLKQNDQFVAYSSLLQNPNWLLENNSNRIDQKSASLYLSQKNGNRYGGFEYSNALKFEIDKIDVIEKVTPNTIGNIEGRNRTLSYFFPKLKLVSNIKRGLEYNYSTYLYANNLFEAQYLKFKNSEEPTHETDRTLYRSSSEVGVHFNPESVKFDVAYQPVFSSLQKTDWLSSKVDLSYFFEVDKKYLDEIELIGSFNRRAKNQELFLSRANYSSQLNTTYETQGSVYDIPLFLPSDLNNEIAETSRIGVILINKYRRNTLRTSLVYRNLRQSDVIFPIIENGDFVLRNVGDFRTNALEWRSDIHLRSNRNNLSYKGRFNLVKYNTRVTRVADHENKIILSGFSNISKQFLKDQPIGVIVGSDYKRTEDGELIISNDGFPTLDERQHVIGDPTPLFVAEMSHKIARGNFYMNVKLDGQLGGHLWNGTQQALDYYGVSQHTAEHRNTTDFVFDGVDEDGVVNTKEVSLADPSKGIEGNRWTRYGIEGIASDYIMDASYLRLKKISIGYTKRLYNSRVVKFNLFATNLLTLAQFKGFTSNYLFEDDLSSGLQYFNQPISTQIGFSAHFKI